jgi:hypothetical protein
MICCCLIRGSGGVTGPRHTLPPKVVTVQDFPDMAAEITNYVLTVEDLFEMH